MTTRDFIIGAAALALIGGAGCSGDGNARSEGSATAAYEALAVQLQNCANDALNCLGAANCDDAAEQVCRENFHACREQTRAAYRAFFTAARECFATKWECVSDAGWDDAGAADRAACHDQFHMCIADNRPIRGPAGPCMQGLRDCVRADLMPGEHPSREVVHDCLGAAHQCVLDRLPMCGPEDDGAAGGGGAGAAGSGGAGASAGAGAGAGGEAGSGP